MVYVFLVTWALTSPVVVAPLFKIIFFVGLALLAFAWYKDTLCHSILKKSKKEVGDKKQLLALICHLLEKEDDLEKVTRILTRLSLVIQWELSFGLTAAKKERLIRFLKDSIQVRDRWLEENKPNHFSSSNASQDTWYRVLCEVEDLQQLRSILLKGQ
jgi:hypothetical protein